MLALLCGPVQDWEGVEVAIYSNSQGHWVVRFSLDTVESAGALAAYMNVLLRCNPLVLKLQMARVVEHWNVMPGDGFLYFTLRPPWARISPRPLPQFPGAAKILQLPHWLL